jgi:hypothetical protein
VYGPAVEFTYRARLRIEGLTLAASGTVGSVVLLAATGQAARAPLSTAGQLAVVAALLAWLGPRGLRRAIGRSEPLTDDRATGGQPTPLWQAPLGVAALTVLAGVLGGWDAGLRVTLGCVLVGLTQGVLLARLVAVEERASGRVFLRVAGSSWYRGTRLGYRAATARASRPKLAADPARVKPSPARRRPLAATTRPPRRSTVLARAAPSSTGAGAVARAK